MHTDDLIKHVTTSLRQVPGIVAIVLGGSRARGTHTEQSDIDVGLYYDSLIQPIDVEALNEVATQLDDEHRQSLVTPIGGWGPWINGGGWLTVQGVPVDLLYRDLQQVAKVAKDCAEGRVTTDYQPGHPHGFHNYMYLSEIALCHVLWDPQERITCWQKQTVPYPKPLQRAIISKFLWEATFSLQNARKGVNRGDLTYLAGCCFRTVMCLNQALFAYNEVYWMNEKGSTSLVDTFPVHPAGYATRVNETFGRLPIGASGLQEAIGLLEALTTETESMIEAGKPV